MTGQLDTKRMRACAPLLPAPGDRVIVECLDEIEQLQSSLSAARAEVARLSAENAALLRGEFICRSCGLRKNAESSGSAEF